MASKMGPVYVTAIAKYGFYSPHPLTLFMPTVVGGF